MFSVGVIHRYTPVQGQPGLLLCDAQAEGEAAHVVSS